MRLTNHGLRSSDPRMANRAGPSVVCGQKVAASHPLIGIRRSPFANRNDRTLGGGRISSAEVGEMIAAGTDLTGL
ncbi:unnamed protein product [Arabis nemorensis]|uniref:Uncharacterized protein n=1 Tax=Arabis nemorensis TaxID=586526 RepID=A0A565CAU8_9BRAS|nr:unnamed protein product [Arabis nemorensis]